MKKIAAWLCSLVMFCMLAASVTFVLPNIAFGQAPTCSVTAGGQIIIVGGKAICFPPTSSSCPITVGTLTLSAVVARSSGISPFVAFIDATGTIDTATLGGANTVVQDVNFAWTYGDTGSSGTGTWANGSNAGHNSTNNSTGIVGAHMYVVPDGAGDKNYTVQVVAFDGTNTASCNVGVTAFDPIGSNGFTSTTCFSNAGVFTGCPAGATHTTSSVVTGGSLTGKRLLYNCGDTFTTAGVTISGTKGQIGAYGGCQGTTSNRPIIQATAGTNGIIQGTNPSADIRITDLVLNGNSQAGVIMFSNGAGGSINTGNKLLQYTFYNVDVKNSAAAIQWNAGGQMAIVSSVAEPILTAVKNINIFTNFAGVGNGNFGGVGTCSACLWSVSGTSEDFLFVAGNNFENSVGTNATSDEVFRDSFAVREVISNNTMSNAGTSTGFAIIKYHNLNFTTDGMNPGGWSGLFSQYDEISDNLLLGSSGAQCFEISPQNAQSDERLRFIVMERNSLQCTESFGRQALLSGVNFTFRDNVLISVPGNGTTTSNAGAQAAQRGIEPAPQGVEMYNNTCSATTASPANGLACIQFTTSGQTGTTVTTNSFAINNLSFNASSTIQNTSGTNTISNNTTNANNSANPAFTNGSGSFVLISDFKPTANFTGGTSVPNWFDALGTQWSPTWDLGAVHH